MPPKGGNAKKEGGRAKKEENEKAKKEAEAGAKVSSDCARSKTTLLNGSWPAPSHSDLSSQAKNEEAEWSQGAKSNKAKEDKEAKKAAEAARKAENARLLVQFFVALSNCMLYSNP